MRSVMQHSFSRVPKTDIQRSQFNRSHGLKTTFDAGFLVPIFVDEALPGDTFNCKMHAFARMTTPIVPIMDNLFMETFFFAVPYRLVWENWERFNGEQDNPTDSTDFLVPQLVTPSDVGWPYGSLADYFGIPVNAPNLSFSALWHRAYNLIWNDWFRDQNLQDSVVVEKGDGPDDPADYTLLRRNKRHDYFTSCLPWPQKGPAVPLPLGTTAPILRVDGADDFVLPYLKGTNTSAAAGNITVNSNALYSAGSSDYVTLDPNGTLYADLSDATAATINQLRQAFQIQKLYEKDARGGTRYTEIIRSHFQVVSDDARLQRPEYLGGGSSMINIHPIAQTSATLDGETPQGTLAAMGTASFSGHGFVKSFTEHCLLIGLVNVRADLNYQQGLNRMWSRSTRWDFYWPSLAHIGEQAVLSKEIFAEGNPTPGPNPDDEQVFGYQERYAEYRYKPSMITGKFRSQIPMGSLDMWHLAQEFETRPELDEVFIADNPPMERVLAVDEEPHFLLDAYFDLKCARPMPVYSVPGLIDHF